MTMVVRSKHIYRTDISSVNLLLHAWSSASWTIFSLTLSSALVASSNKRIVGCLTRARASAMRCFSPPLSWTPRSPTSVSYLYFNNGSFNNRSKERNEYKHLVVPWWSCVHSLVVLLLRFVPVLQSLYHNEYSHRYFDWTKSVSLVHIYLLRIPERNTYRFLTDHSDILSKLFEMIIVDRLTIDGDFTRWQVILTKKKRNTCTFSYRTNHSLEYMHFYEEYLPQPLEPTRAVVCPARAINESRLRTDTSCRDG